MHGLRCSEPLFLDFYYIPKICMLMILQNETLICSPFSTRSLGFGVEVSRFKLHEPHVSP